MSGFLGGITIFMAPVFDLGALVGRFIILYAIFTCSIFWTVPGVSTSSICGEFVADLTKVCLCVKRGFADCGLFWCLLPGRRAAMGINLQKQSLQSLTMMDLEANLEIKKIETTLKSIPTHQQPHFHATQGSVQLHLSRIKETQRSKPKNSWLTHTSNCHRFGNTVWNRQLHKSEYTKSHVKHPKPKQLRQQLKKRRNLDFNRILNKKLGSGVDSDDINHYKQVVQSTRMTRGY